MQKLRPSDSQSSAKSKRAKTSDDDRERLAEVCRLWGDQLSGKKFRGKSGAPALAATTTAATAASAPANPPNQGDTPRLASVLASVAVSVPVSVAGNSPLPRLAPRLLRTLECLLAGDGEKQIAKNLKLSRHTVHDYVKGVYRRFNVNSRAELLALWIKKSGGAEDNAR